MAQGEDLIDFDVIENQKENIQALPSGRSAKALATVFSPLAPKNSPLSNTQDLNNAARQEFEREIQSIDDSDDPLDVYDRYVRWTLDTYPSAQATPQSQLLPLLERATKAFISWNNYKNDPRYLRIWLHFIRFFSDAPRETFVYLSRHGVGESLALYYEEFAAWLEGAGRWKQAEEVYKMGIEKEARPAERLLRKFGEFEKRKEAREDASADEPSSPALPTVRPALASKTDPFATASPPNAHSQNPQQNAASKKSKLAIFSDSGEEEHRPSSNGSAKGWETIGTLAERKKENTISAKPWTGETLQSSAPRQQGVPKMSIFKDQSLQEQSSRVNQSRAHRVVNPKTGRVERVAVNLDAIYPNPKNPREQYCFEELRARKLGWLQKDWRVPSPPEEKSQATVPVKFSDSPMKKQIDSTVTLTGSVTQQLILNDENDENGSSRVKKSRDDVARRLRREEKANRTRKVKVREVKQETQTIQTNLDSPRGPKMRKKKTAEPTMTLVTKAAMEDIYDIFNQPLKSTPEEGDEPEEESDSEVDESDEDDYTSGGESTGTGRISTNTSELGDDTRGDLDDDDTGIADGEATATNTAFSELDRAEGLSDSDSEEGDTTQERTGMTMTDHTDASEKLVDIDDAEDTMEEGEVSESAAETEEVTTPTSPEAIETKRTSFVPVQPEDYEPPLRHNPYRDPNSRLPYMTPIVEKTESSLGTVTRKRDSDFFGAKTPCPKNGNRTPIIPENEDELWSSPFQQPMNGLSSPKVEEPLAQPKLVKDEQIEAAVEENKENVPVREPAKEEVKESVTSSVPVVPQPRVRPQTAVKSTKEVASRGPIIKELQVNPMDPHIHSTILAEIQPPLSTYEGYFDHSSVSFNHKTEVKKFCKAPKGGQMPTLELPGSSYKYTIKRELGAGAFAPVYLADSASIVEAQNEQDNEARAKAQSFAQRPSSLAAIKSEHPPSAWEFYIISTAHRRLGVSRAADSIVRAYEHHQFADECYLIEEYRDQGTLLDLVNVLRDGPGAGIDEMLAMFFTVELLRTLEGLHSKQLIHGDLKADNVLVRLPASDSNSTDHDASIEPLSAQFSKRGANGWSRRGLTLIDLGRGIDLRAFVADKVGFVADWPTTQADCAEMRELRPWTFQADYHGVAAIVHTLLFGRYIDTVPDKSAAAVGPGGKAVWKLREPLKRYWQTDLWTDLFVMLLNPVRYAAGSDAADGETGLGAAAQREAAGKMPLLNGMRSVRERMEGWLETNCERGVGLKGLVRRAEMALAKRK